MWGKPLHRRLAEELPSALGEAPPPTSASNDAGWTRAVYAQRRASLIGALFRFRGWQGWSRRDPHDSAGPPLGGYVNVAMRYGEARIYIWWSKASGASVPADALCLSGHLPQENSPDRLNQDDYLAYAMTDALAQLHLLEVPEDVAAGMVFGVVERWRSAEVS